MDPNFEIANRGKRPLMVHSDLLWHQMQVEVSVVVVVVVSVVVVVVAVVVLPNGSSQSMTCHYPFQVPTWLRGKWSDICFHGNNYL